MVAEQVTPLVWAAAQPRAALAAVAGTNLNLFRAQQVKVLRVVCAASVPHTAQGVAAQAQQAETSTAALVALVALASSPPSTAQPLSVQGAALRRTSKLIAATLEGQGAVVLVETPLEQLLAKPHQTVPQAPVAVAAHPATADQVLS